MIQFCSHSHDQTDLWDCGVVWFLLLVPESHAPFLSLSLGPTMSVRSGRRVFVHRKVKLLLEKKRNGIWDGHQQQLSTVISLLGLLLSLSYRCDHEIIFSFAHSYLLFSLHLLFHYTDPLRDFISQAAPIFKGILKALRDPIFLSICW